MLLFAFGIEARERAQRAIIFKSDIDLLCYRVSDFEVRGELETFLFSWSCKRALQRGIERKIPTAEILIDDRTNLPTPRIFGKLSAHEADLLRKTNPYRPMPLWRNSKARPNVRADIIPSAAVACAGEDIEAGFEPIVEAVGDLDRLVPGVMRWQRAVDGFLRAFRSEVVVQFDHCDAAWDCLRAIDLDLVIVLRLNCRVNAEGRDENDENEFELAFQWRMHLKDLSRTRAFYNSLERAGSEALTALWISDARNYYTANR